MRISKGFIEEAPEEFDFRLYKRKPTPDTKAMYMNGPIDIETIDGVIHLPRKWRGYVVLDQDGHPYPVEESIFHRSYEEV